jgi:flavin reductase (DIM6/NTAB) family NADH-FMN oxidoreductase RutF
MTALKQHQNPGENDFITIQPTILYFGTPVGLVSTLNPDGSPNLAPISSFWAFGWTMTLGLLGETQTLKNLKARPECVINLPSPDLWEPVERLAPLTGLNPVPERKKSQFRFEPDKFRVAGFAMIPSETIEPSRVKECPVQMEASVQKIFDLAGDGRLQDLGGGAAVETQIRRVHARKNVVTQGHSIAPDKWQPLIYNFRHYFGLAEELGKTFRAEL